MIGRIIYLLSYLIMLPLVILSVILGVFVLLPIGIIRFILIGGDDEEIFDIMMLGTDFITDLHERIFE